MSIFISIKRIFIVYFRLILSINLIIVYHYLLTFRL